MAVIKVSAALRITGRRASDTAARVTAVLGIQPTNSVEFSDPHPSRSLAAQGKLAAQSKWIFEEARTVSREEDPHGIESLVRLADRFEPHAAALAELAENYWIVVLMHGISDSSQGGLVIGPETMRRLGLLSASLMQTISLREQLTAEDLAGWDTV